MKLGFSRGGAAAVLSFLLGAGSLQGQSGRSQPITYRSSVDGESLTGVLWAPAGFNRNGPPVPLLVYLHGGGGTGQVLLSHFDGALTRELDARGWIGIAPDGRRWGLASQGCEWRTSAAYVNSSDPNVGPGEQDIFDVIDWAVANFPINTNRIYLAGSSMGGRGAYIIGLKNPDRFAGIAAFAPATDMYELFLRPDNPVCKEGMVGGRPGDSLRVDTMYTITSARFLIENAYNLPVFHGHGTQDNVAFNIPGTGRFLHGFHITSDTTWNGCHGNTNLCFGHTPTLSELRTRHPDAYDWAFMFTPVGHTGDARWIQGARKSSDALGTEDPRNPGALIGTIEFLSRRTRQISPDTVVYKTYTDTHRKAYWTEIRITTPWQDVPGAVRAKRNRTTNSLDVELARAAAATFDLPLAGLRVGPEAPLTINLRRLVERVFDPALADSDEPLEPQLVLRGDFSAIRRVTVLRDGAPLPSSSVQLSERELAISRISAGAPTVLTIRAEASGARTVSSVSAASFHGSPLAQESIVSAFGTNLATSTLAASTVPLPTSLGGTAVKVRDSAGIERLAPLFAVSPGQVNYQMPLGTAAGTATIAVTGGDGTVSTGTAQVAVVAPGLFAANANGQGVPAAAVLRVRADGSQSSEPVAQFDAAQNRFVAVPIDLGPESDQVFLILFATGIRYRSSLSAVGAQIGGVDAPVLFAGAQGSFVGLDQVNVRLPRSLLGRGAVDVRLFVDGQPSNTVQISIR
ncbi:MAG: prolyl oligopeptidase family serine peptidase [Acidobacteria bacterium]|nr:prolyl oligopeptidase family serine peptidase [Acidobacteriota bacterium]